ncbi:MAG: hypothetical protein VKO00_08610 [Cyanobacteriota bacterium]|nr:hypothetical protein [Cyanobacteriota bacterium]
MQAAAPAETIAFLALTWRQLFRRFFSLLTAVAIVLAFVLVLNHPDRLPVFLAAVGPALGILLVSRKGTPAVLPVFQLYVLLQALSFASPLFAPEIVADRRLTVSPELLDSCILPILLWFLALWLGWGLTPFGLGRLRPRRALTDALRNPGLLPHLSLSVAAGLQLLISSPLYWQLPGTLASGLLTPIRTLLSLAGIAGAFTGAYAWAQGRLSSRWLWLLLLAVPMAASFTSLLLSSLQGILFASLLGLWLGRSRQALAITLAGLVLIGFLNTGKAAMRLIYWNQGASLPSNPVVLLQEWTLASLASINQSGDEAPTNLFTDRFNNLQNILYVQQQLQAGTPTLDGDSLSVIPQVLVPRFLDPEKIRSHEGQVRLNLHFGRQQSVEDTEKAYIAWGFLAEGVGNFGSAFGPIFMGVVTGALLRITENIGRGQLILSTPGLLSLALTVFWLTTYEMAASTFVAAVFQIVIVVLLVGWWFGGRSTQRRRLA